MNSWIPGIDKLVELTASGIGAIAGTFLATWKAPKEGEARIVAAEADAKILEIRTEAHTKARELLVSDDSIAGGEIDIADLVSERITYQERKRQTNIRGVVAKAAAELEHKEVPTDQPPGTLRAKPAEEPERPLLEARSVATGQA